MKTLTLLLLVSMSPWTNLANAQETKIAPLKLSEYQIVGRGMEDKKTKDTIAIACLDSACAQLQHLYLNHATREMKVIGPVYQVVTKGSASEEQIRATLRSAHRQYVKNKREKRDFDPQAAISSGFGLAYGAIGFAIPSTLVFMLSPAGVITFAAVILCVEATDYSNRAINFSADHISKVFVDQNGWSWAEAPGHVSHHRFKAYLRYL